MNQKDADSPRPMVEDVQPQAVDHAGTRNHMVILPEKGGGKRYCLPVKRAGLMRCNAIYDCSSYTAEGGGQAHLCRFFLALGTSYSVSYLEHVHC
ncbi:hypothetical protein [Bradyrhizobium sp. sBnM-33]|uniref:hypothetical protein n=1 Tax=Bradyrhizobium sp. sBnM-33 TaxID=2831780 RepID=UPI00293E4292|nr:hypothetical protein [Bradyrhizobium sp. sBnM-33]WOH52629.1 hypothetical protein RX328_11040 [Bradyrhizobium sp. sBnM-33]